MRAWSDVNPISLFPVLPDDSAMFLSSEEVRSCNLWSEFMELRWSRDAGLSGDRKVVFGEEAWLSEIAVTWRMARMGNLLLFVDCAVLVKWSF